MNAFFNLLYSLKLRQGGKDKIGWIPTKRKFEVSLSFHALSIPIGSHFLGRVSQELSPIQEWHFVNDDTREDIFF